ncbi:NUDIX domain-containing protein [Paludibacterium purpuratum]|uniref:GDP-mannose pyrophosphatase n=1 Tax=Paludibacterium purpuratum TaxID=1144873 RepID=A0A4R7BAU7_9NEIS|nr:NUDIX hydrolase [Paludibacterium purpuratum]TDR82080.1 ADP-ribose pyrophosphatase [Paludibacterium purpuratum]
MDLTEKTIDSQLVFEGGFLKVRRDRIQLPDGSEGWREYIRHPGAVAVLALTDDRQLVMERQYRYPAGREFLEIPAGKLDPDETREACAQRELWEETGYSASEWTFLGTAHPCIGYADEQIHYFLARGLTQSARQLDHGEFLEVVTLPLAEVIARTLNGAICDSKSLVGLYWLQAHLEGRMPGAV